mgnify:CR=1 FL=1
MSSKMAQLLNEKMVDFKSIIIKTEPVDYRSDDNEYGDSKDDAIINTEIVLNNVDVVKRELNDEENDYEAFDVNTTEPEDSTDDQGDDPHLDVDIDEKPGKNTIGKKLLIFLIFFREIEVGNSQTGQIRFVLTIFFFLLKIVNFYCSKIVTL